MLMSVRPVCKLGVRRTGCAEKKMSFFEKMAPHTMAASWAWLVCARFVGVGILTIQMPACAMEAVPGTALVRG
jgi:hypothetical protein